MKDIWILWIHETGDKNCHRLNPNIFGLYETSDRAKARAETFSANIHNEKLNWTYKFFNKINEIEATNKDFRYQIVKHTINEEKDFTYEDKQKQETGLITITSKQEVARSNFFSTGATEHHWSCKCSKCCEAERLPDVPIVTSPYASSDSKEPAPVTFSSCDTPWKPDAK